MDVARFLHRGFLIHGDQLPDPIASACRLHVNQEQAIDRMVILYVLLIHLLLAILVNLRTLSFTCKGEATVNHIGLCL